MPQLHFSYEIHCCHSYILAMKSTAAPVTF